VELLEDDEEPDAGKHAVDDGGRDGSEPAAGFERSGDELQQTSEDEDGAECGEAVIADDSKTMTARPAAGPLTWRWRAGGREPTTMPPMMPVRMPAAAGLRRLRRCPCRGVAPRGIRRARRRDL